VRRQRRANDDHAPQAGGVHVLGAQDVEQPAQARHVHERARDPQPLDDVRERRR
jgi:hypothetical protein